MARIVGIDLPKNKRVEIGLTYIYGIGRETSKAILQEAGVNFDTRIKDLTEEEVGKLTNIITKNFKVEGDLRREISQNIRRLRDIKSYRGLRHKNNLPCRGQRTKTNARTRRGKKSMAVKLNRPVGK
jgi:small subunit ribosomal protein S13